MMMKIIENGNIFDTKCQTIVCTVNCMGVWGKGIALECKKRFPKAYQRHRYFCKQGLIKPGILYINRDYEKWILCFPTKEHWINPSKPEYLILGLDKFIDTWREQGITSIAWPLLGASNGKLNPDYVRDLMNIKLGMLRDKLDIEIYDNSIRII